MVRILLADDHEIVRTGLKRVIAKCEDWVVCGEAANGLQAVCQALRMEPDLVILDIHMPVLDGVHAAIKIRELVPDAKILMLSVYDMSLLPRAPDSIADAYFSKGGSNNELVEAIKGLTCSQTPPC